MSEFQPGDIVTYRLMGENEEGLTDWGTVLGQVISVHGDRCLVEVLGGDYDLSDPSGEHPPIRLHIPQAALNKERIH